MQKRVTQQLINFINKPAVQRFATFAAIAGVSMFMADDVAASLETQLDRVNTLFNGRVLKTGLAVGTIVGAIVSAAKGAVGMMLAIIGIGVCLAFYLGWIQSDGFVQQVAG